jgi:solute carrier family 25 (adenine nucleotide translocator) protein 4/5/6/31
LISDEHESQPVVLQGSLQDSFIASFFLGWAVATGMMMNEVWFVLSDHFTGAGLASHPIDIVRRRMTIMKPAKSVSSLSVFRDIIKKEGVKSLFRGAGVGIPRRAVAGAAVLALYDKLHLLLLSS